MTRKILQKIIDELKQESPKLDYIRGILETLIESLPEDKIVINSITHLPINSVLDKVLEEKSTMSEAEILDAKARASLAEIKRLSEIGQNG